eukprot:ANDGO_01564.mRNA.1 hypothetical protein
MEECSSAYDAIEQVVSQDPGNRGIGPLVQRGSLARCISALKLDSSDSSSLNPSTVTHVAVLSGFCIPPAETDGPPGVFALCRSILVAFPNAIASVMCDITTVQVVYMALSPLFEDSRFANRLYVYAFPTDYSHAEFMNLVDTVEPRVPQMPEHSLVVYRNRSPEDQVLREVYGGDGDESCFQKVFLASVPHVEHYAGEPMHRFFARSVSHAIALERSGTSVSRANTNYTMKARDVTKYHSPLQLIWDSVFVPHCFTIGVGDGGNEIGMGKIADLVAQHIPNGDTIGCASSCSEILVCGVSNWGGWAIAACLLGSQRFESEFPFCENNGKDVEENCVDRCIQAGGVDGVLRAAVCSVDGLPIQEHIHVRRAIFDILVQHNL